MLEKKYIPETKACEVTFSMPDDEIPNGVVPYQVTLAGEFNDWDMEATPMLFNEETCAYQVTLDLEPSSQYQYRYVINNDLWYNDWEADAYAPSQVCGDDNCVVFTPGLESVEEAAA